MAHKVDWYDSDTYESITSRDEYTEHQVTAIRKAEDAWGRDEGRLLTLYVHEETGLVTDDVGRFEKWLEKVSGC